MRDADCTAFLQWALPQLDMHWLGFRKVRHQVCKRVRHRIAALGLNGFAAYRERLEGDAQEWRVLDQFCHITMSRFFRDRGVFDCLRTGILPTVAERACSERRPVRCWSAGCASGEEPYSMRILWDLGSGCAGPKTEMLLVATDIDGELLARARVGCYGRTSLREVPPDLIARAFEQVGSHFCIQEQHREGVIFLKQDLRSEAPSGAFDLILCRYLAFTYFAPSLRQKVLTVFAERLVPDGFLVVGSHEQLADPRFVSAAGMPHVFTKAG
ncbi:chemotaxis protein CheR [Bradyrhizobium sp. CSA112]|uniref:CheR family methyltransferase n=1 Tax=Bradyrhizobium sp. CSA112 TaxID=2699170 RepID=UPI0023B10894|nr:CheR family methyltransferase [Bradyrhizobium sp. CSA112]MDE5454260.1 chemotaxis protein CheR [Bradyrhizobium sp. CSA112]